MRTNKRGHYQWTKRQDRQLGTLPDHTLADRWGVSDEAVRRRRRRLGVEAYRPERTWTPEMIAAANDCNTCEEAAHDIGVSVGAVRVARHRYPSEGQSPMRLRAVREQRR